MSLRRIGDSLLWSPLAIHRQLLLYLQPQPLSIQHQELIMPIEILCSKTIPGSWSTRPSICQFTSTRQPMQPLPLGSARQPRRHLSTTSLVSSMSKTIH